MEERLYDVQIDIQAACQQLCECRERTTDQAAREEMARLSLLLAAACNDVMRLRMTLASPPALMAVPNDGECHKCGQSGFPRGWCCV